MNRTDLQALRRLLFFTPRDAAQFIAASQEQPNGVAEETWLAWESGAQPIPERVADRIAELSEWRSDALAATADNIRIQITEKDGMPESVFVIWYENLDDWLSLPNREPLMWRLQQSVCAGLRGMYSLVKLVCFDKESYKTWLGDRDDCESARAEWASTV